MKRLAECGDGQLDEYISISSIMISAKFNCRIIILCNWSTFTVVFLEPQSHTSSSEESITSHLKREKEHVEEAAEGNDRRS